MGVNGELGVSVQVSGVTVMRVVCTYMYVCMYYVLV